MIAPRYLIARFGHEEDLLAAIKQSRAAGLEIQDAYTPYAVHGIESAMGLRPSRLTWVCFLCGLVGAALMLYFEYWSSWLDWPINVAGKPFDSLPAFVPITFEAAVLCAGLGSVLALFLRCKLFPGKQPDLPAPGITDDQFALVLRLRDASFGIEDVRRLLASHGMTGFDERVGQEDDR